ncbi:hypothetical protein [Rudanella paleaurantiibacter]|uniref:hypothetical protein n=1 Tax=Rudanella paleaurantiibacter TaxID=2614655 RepID=UPI00162806CD|nr:hypothetical protein [Rudanella paleaurantiibacter]
MKTITTTGTLEQTGVPENTTVTVPDWIADSYIADGVAYLAEEEIPEPDEEPEPDGESEPDEEPAPEPETEPEKGEPAPDPEKATVEEKPEKCKKA